MLEKGRIGNFQLYLIILFIILPTAILSVPAVTTGIAKQAGWLAMALSLGFGVAMAVLYSIYFIKFPSKNLLEVGEMAFGKWVGRLIGIGYIGFLLHTGAAIIREFGEFLVTAVMPDTPLSVFIITITLLAAWAVYNGLEVIGRMSEFVFPLLSAATLIVITLVVGEFDFARLKPLQIFDMKVLLAASLIPSSWMGEAVLVTFIIPYVYQARKQSWLWVIGAIVTVGSLLIIITSATILVFGYAEAARLTFPTFSLARIISIGDIIERTESLVMAVWVAGVFVKITLWFYILVLVTAQTFGLKSYKPLILPYAFCLITLSFWLFRNIMGFFQYISTTFPFWAMSFEVLIPIAVLTVALVRKRGKETSENKQEA